MGLPPDYVSLELDLQVLYFRLPTFFENLDDLFDKYTVVYFKGLFERRKPYPFQRVGFSFDDPEEFRKYLVSLFLYHPMIKSVKDFGKVDINFIDPKNKINAACFMRHRTHLEQLEMGLINDISNINYFAGTQNIEYDAVLRSSDILFLAQNSNVRLESIALYERVHPFLGVVFAFATKIERKAFELTYRRIRKLSDLLNLTDDKIRRYEKLIVDTRNKIC
jgi:hypothetical protein